MIIKLTDLQPWRCGCPTAARDYARRIKAGERLKPIQVIRQRGRYRFRIFDGMHRARGARIAGQATVEAVVIGRAP
jgi:hypothetical protein